MKASTAVVVALVALVAASGAWAAGASNDEVIAGFTGSIHPRVLPRHHPAPVAVRVSGGIESVSGNEDELPQLRTIRVGINRTGKLFDRGLPICRPRNVQPATEAGALAECRAAVVGHGRVELQVRIAGQLPFQISAPLLAFNGPRHEGHKLIIAQVYAGDPPGSFILPFRIERQPGVYGTALTTTLPRGTRKWAYLTHFEMSLHRRYRYHGKMRSYVSAACRAPAGFPGAVFPFAEATYTFGGGRQLTLSESATCRVARNG